MTKSIGCDSGFQKYALDIRSGLHDHSFHQRFFWGVRVLQREYPGNGPRFYVFFTKSPDAASAMTSSGDAVAKAEAAFASAERGDAVDLPAVLSTLDVGQESHRAWALVLRATLQALDPAAARAVEPGELQSFAGACATVRAVVELAASRLERAALLTLDPERLAALVAVHELLAMETTSLSLANGHLWSRLLNGASVDPAEPESIGRAAFMGKDGGAVVEAAVLRALATPGAAEALRLVRRASHMAASEGRPDVEALALLALARLRRRAGKAHLSLHVLVTIAQQVAPAWRPWVAYELVLAGGGDRARALLNDGTDAPANGWSHLAHTTAALVAAAGAGARDAFDEAARSLAQRTTATWGDVDEEVRALPPLLDERRFPSAVVLGWRQGTYHAVPWGFEAYGAGTSDADETVAYVIARPGGSAARVLRAGLPLAPDALLLPHETNDGSGGGRTESALAALALGGAAGLPRERFFREVYGFAYDRERHEGVLKILLHRMRARLDQHGTVARTADDAFLYLDLRRPLAIPDGRCDPPPEARVLRTLAALGQADTQALADALAMPLRTVQRRLKQLVDDGACRSARDAGAVIYRVLDTSFTSVSWPRAPRQDASSK